MINNFLFIIIGLALPILLLPIEYFLPFPHFVEEIAKLTVLLLLGIQLKNKVTFINALLFAIAFTVSESMLYMMNFFILGQLYLLPKRLFVTGLLHIGTVLLLFTSLHKNLAWKIFVLIIAICIHYVYNESIAIVFNN